MVQECEAMDALHPQPTPYWWRRESGEWQYYANLSILWLASVLLAMAVHLNQTFGVCLVNVWKIVIFTIFTAYLQFASHSLKEKS